LQLRLSEKGEFPFLYFMFLPDVPSPRVLSQAWKMGTAAHSLRSPDIHGKAVSMSLTQAFVATKSF
jgi:hypothetical protein